MKDEGIYSNVMLFPPCCRGYMETDPTRTDGAFDKIKRDKNKKHNSVPRAIFRESKGGVCRGEAGLHHESRVLELCWVAALHC